MRALQQVSPRVWVATSTTWHTTSTVVVADDGSCLLVDPTLTPAEIESLAREVTARGWRVTAAFSTHAHWDHLLWASTLPCVPRWATTMAAAWTQEHADSLVADAARDLPGHHWEIIGGTTPLPTARVELPWPGPRAVVLETPAHAPGHASLLLPDERVLVVGDLLSDIEVPLLDLGSPDPVGDYRRVLRELTEVVAGCDAVVPGHGRVTDGAGAARRVAADLRYLDAVGAGAEPNDPRLRTPRIRSDHLTQVQTLRGRDRRHRGHQPEHSSP